jgi:hypothetical protein
VAASYPSHNCSTAQGARWKDQSASLWQCGDCYKKGLKGGRKKRTRASLSPPASKGGSQQPRGDLDPPSEAATKRRKTSLARPPESSGSDPSDEDTPLWKVKRRRKRGARSQRERSSSDSSSSDVSDSDTSSSDRSPPRRSHPKKGGNRHKRKRGAHRPAPARSQTPPYTEDSVSSEGEAQPPTSGHASTDESSGESEAQPAQNLGSGAVPNLHAVLDVLQSISSKMVDPLACLRGEQWDEESISDFMASEEARVVAGRLGLRWSKLVLEAVVERWKARRLLLPRNPPLSVTFNLDPFSHPQGLQQAGPTRNQPQQVARASTAGQQRQGPSDPPAQPRGQQQSRGPAGGEAQAGSRGSLATADPPSRLAPPPVQGRGQQQGAAQATQLQQSGAAQATQGQHSGAAQATQNAGRAGQASSRSPLALSGSPPSSAPRSELGSASTEELLIELELAKRRRQLAASAPPPSRNPQPAWGLGLEASADSTAAPMDVASTSPEGELLALITPERLALAVRPESFEARMVLADAAAACDRKYASDALLKGDCVDDVLIFVKSHLDHATAKQLRQRHYTVRDLSEMSADEAFNLLNDFSDYIATHATLGTLHDSTTFLRRSAKEVFNRLLGSSLADSAVTHFIREHLHRVSRPSRIPTQYQMVDRVVSEFATHSSHAPLAKPARSSLAGPHSARPPTASSQQSRGRLPATVAPSRQAPASQQGKGSSSSRKEAVVCLLCGGRHQSDECRGTAAKPQCGVCGGTHFAQDCESTPKVACVLCQQAKKGDHVHKVKDCPIFRKMAKNLPKAGESSTSQK